MFKTMKNPIFQADFPIKIGAISRRCCSGALQHGPSAAALLRRARAQLALRETAEAAADLEAAEELEPENAEQLGAATGHGKSVDVSYVSYQFKQLGHHHVVVEVGFPYPPVSCYILEIAIYFVDLSMKSGDFP